MDTVEKTRSLKFKIGDKVRLKENIDLCYEREEVKIGRTYVVQDVAVSRMFGHYVQLFGISSSYLFEWIEHVEHKS